MIHQEKIALETSGHRDMHDLTDEIEEIVKRSGVTAGTVHIFNVGSTGCVGTVEFEEGLEVDLPAILDQLVPPGDFYRHAQTAHDDNGHSHLQATLMGPSLTVPVSAGKPVLGRWQQIIHLECDIHPRSRTLLVTVQGEKA